MSDALADIPNTTLTSLQKLMSLLAPGTKSFVIIAMNQVIRLPIVQRRSRMSSPQHDP
jgi:hypothetical protein